jgi:hypothetical protein
MTLPEGFKESRRSTRVPLKVTIEVEGQELKCEGETIIVNLHGALITVPAGLEVGMRISVYVFITSKQSYARVVSMPNPLQCGIELEQPQNIWGVSLAPEDWDEGAS